MESTVKKKRKGREAFIRERTRWLLAHEWCPSAVQSRRFIPHDGVVFPLPEKREECPYWQEAINTGWVTGPKGRNPEGFIKASGWSVATAFLKR